MRFRNTSKKYTAKIVSFTLLCVWFCGCSRMDTMEENKDGFRFLINPPLSLEVTTKANPNPQLSGIDVNNVWIIQFNKDDGGCLKGFFVSDKIQISETSELLIELNTKDANFSNVASRFYIIVNGGESLFTTEEIGTGSSIEGGGTTGTLDEAGLKSKTVDFTFPMEDNKLQTTEPTLLTSGPIAYTPDENKIVVVSRMFRAFSKHSITVNYTGKTGVFAPTSVTVNNIPKAMALFEAGGTDNTYYPSTEKIGEDGSLFDTTDRKYTFTWDKKNNTTNAMTFFMPENLRGAGTATGQKEKGVEGKGPNGSLTGCTFLTLEGKYKYEAGQDGEVGVKYRFYLGGNFTDDYNIYRDYHYNMTVNISGANSADLRVTITDGNVAVFDKVEEISNTVEF